MPLYVSGSGKKLAKALNNAVKRDVGMKSRGVQRRTDLWELNGTDMPACILETGSIKADLATLRDHPDKYGKAIAKGICKYMGVKFSDGTKKPAASGAEIYRVRKAWNKPETQRGAFKDLANVKTDIPFLTRGERRFTMAKSRKIDRYYKTIKADPVRVKPSYKSRKIKTLEPGKVIHATKINGHYVYVPALKGWTIWKDSKGQKYVRLLKVAPSTKSDKLISSLKAIAGKLKKTPMKWANSPGTSTLTKPEKTPH